jgi:outer membrane protein assembly factor BamA
LNALILPLFFESAFAADEEMSIHGNVRTKESYIKNLVHECLENMPSDSQDPDSLRQCLMNSKLFSEVIVERDQGKMKITVTDKWTLIPVPSVSAGSGDTKSAGLFLFESNFLGQGMNLVLGAVSSNRGDTYFGIIADPSLFFSRWNYSLSVFKQSQQLMFQRDGTTIDGFEEDKHFFEGSLGYRFGNWTLSGIASYNQATYDPYLDFAGLEDNVAKKMGGIFSYDNRNYRLYFSEGAALTITYDADVNRSDGERLSRQLYSEFNWQKAFFSDQVLQMGVAQGMMDGGTRADLFRIGGTNGFRGIEARTELVDRYLVSSFDYQFPLASFESGALTTGPFVDLGRLFERRDPAVTDFVSSGLGIYYFLKQIAFPGVGLQFGYNEKFQGQFFSAYVGFAK